MNLSQPDGTTDGNAIVYCEGAFATTYGKTAHGLVRFTRRYRVLGIIDSECAGQDAGALLDEVPRGIPIFGTLDEAWTHAEQNRTRVTHFVIGLAPDGGRLAPEARAVVCAALQKGLNVDSGLHEFLSEDPEFKSLAQQCHVKIRDIRNPPPHHELHFFSGKIEAVDALKIAVLGTDSAVGKRTTAWRIVDGFEKQGVACEMVGTGQTAWLQGARYTLAMDALVNDFVSGEIEHAVWSAWNDKRPAVIVIEGQGSLMNPAYPGGFEILAAGRPDIIVLQHAPARKVYDGFPGYPIQPLARQIEVIELLSGKPVVAVSINHENLRRDQISMVCDAIACVTGLPAFDVLIDGADGLVKVLKSYLS